MKPGQLVQTPKGPGRLLTRIRPGGERWLVLFGTMVEAFDVDVLELIQEGGERMKPDG